ncbi:GNAT family N-acetyltransferase [Listeria weihenstephanensis]|uniref:GNAT family N-acetyltransferase n=1 Tax=Listeria weihenstephanensis TaxID=1006155 RepID=A0A841ZA60_9LIST|nr:GNAT family N-acetyltransferase [Listeria weihenstephanensis]MBC1501759.1 GNAT family N-acetyltransferase [Listeria weihenstephanensis]
MEIKKWLKYDIIPYEILLLADPDIPTIDRYFFESDVFLLQDGTYVSGVICIKSKEEAAEIMNIAIAPEYQGHKYGTQLLEHAIHHVTSLHKDQIIIKTANSSIQALAFYQKLGFRMIAIIPDFFTKHYPDPIWENGILAQDQIVLSRLIAT